MCGIVGAVTHTPVNQLLYDSLLLLQHRGQEAAGIVTSEGPVFHMYKAPGYVRDVFRTRNMRELSGNAGIGHCRYPTAGSASSELESQPFYVNSPFGITLAHNGNLTNSEALKRELFQLDFRHVNTDSDSEVLLNVLALELERAAHHAKLDANAIFTAVAAVHKRCRGAYVDEARLRMGGELAKKIAGIPEAQDIDVVIPIPDSSRPSALELANTLGLKYREGFVKNRYIGRTFIMPGQAIRRKTVRQKLNPMGVEFKDKVVLLVDDSIVRGTTSREIVSMAREAGARKVYFASASPPVRFPNVYGIDMPNQRELVATGRNEAEIAREIGADLLIYQDLDALKSAVRATNPALKEFEASCFDGKYITGDITADYLSQLAHERDEQRGDSEDLLDDVKRPVAVD